MMSSGDTPAAVAMRVLRSFRRASRVSFGRPWMNGLIGVPDAALRNTSKGQRATGLIGYGLIGVPDAALRNTSKGQRATDEASH
jgi:hypothetical protein